MVAGRRDEENVGEEGGGSFHLAPHPGNHERDGAVTDALVGHADAALEDCTESVTFIYNVKLNAYIKGLQFCK